MEPAYREFDFLIGEWDLTNLQIQDDGSWVSVGRATNRVFPVAGGCGIVELWDGYLDDAHIRGFSVRTYNSDTETWQLLLNWPQENRAGFSSLEGAFTHGRGDFTSTFTAPDGAPGLTRYTFSDISHDTFRWNDGTSTDGGQTWRTSWVMEFIKGDTGTDAFTVIGYETATKRWTMTHLDGGNGFDVDHGQVEDGTLVFRDDSGAVRSQLIPGNTNSLTRVAGGTNIPFIRR